MSLVIQEIQLQKEYQDTTIPDSKQNFTIRRKVRYHSFLLPTGSPDVIDTRRIRSLDRVEHNLLVNHSLHVPNRLSLRT